MLRSVSASQHYKRHETSIYQYAVLGYTGMKLECRGLGARDDILVWECALLMHVEI